MQTFYTISTIIALLLHTISYFGLPIFYEINLKKRGKLFKNKYTSIKDFKGYILDFIPFVNIISIALNAFVLGCTIKLSDQMLDRFSEAFTAETVKRNYESHESDEKNITDALRLDGANELEIKKELDIVKGHFGKSKENSSYEVTPTFSEADYEWACNYLDASNFIESLFTDITIDKKTKYEIISDLIKYAKEIESMSKNSEVKEVVTEETNNCWEEKRDETVSDKVLSIINKHTFNN